MESVPEQKSEIEERYSVEEIGLVEFTGAIKNLYGVTKEENSVFIFVPTNKDDNRIVALVPPIDSKKSLFFYFDRNSEERTKFNNFLSDFFNQDPFENPEDLFDNDYELLIKIFFNEISLKPENKNLDFQGKVEELKNKLISFSKTDVVTELLERLSKVSNSKNGVILFPIKIKSFWVCAEIVLEIDNFNSYNYNIKFHFPTDEPDCYEMKKIKIFEKLKKILESKNGLLNNDKITINLVYSKYEKVRLRGDSSNYELTALDDLFQRLNGKDLTIRSEAIIRMRHKLISKKNLLLEDFFNNQSKILKDLSIINKNFDLNDAHISLLYKTIVEIYNLVKNKKIQTEQSDLEARTLQATFCLNEIAKHLKTVSNLSMIISIVACGMDSIQFFKKEENSIFKLLMIILNDIKMIIKKSTEEESLKKEITSALLDLYNNYKFFFFRRNSLFHNIFSSLNKEREKEEANLQELIELSILETSVPKKKNKNKNKNKKKINPIAENLIKNEEINIQRNLNVEILNTEEQSNSPVLIDEEKNKNENIIAGNNDQNLSMDILMKKINYMAADIQSLKINNNNLKTNFQADKNSKDAEIKSLKTNFQADKNSKDAEIKSLKANFQADKNIKDKKIQNMTTKIQTLEICIQTQQEKLKMLNNKLIEKEKSEASLKKQVDTLQSYYNRLVIREEIKIFKNTISKQVLKIEKLNNSEFVDQCGTNDEALSFERNCNVTTGSLKSFFVALINYEIKCHSHIHNLSFNLNDADSFTNFQQIFNEEFRSNGIFYGQSKNNNITILNEVINLYRNAHSSK